MSVGRDSGLSRREAVFVWHYWMQGEPEPLSEKVAWRDYSVAAKYGGKLCAYRWAGNAVLSGEQMVWVKRA